MLRYKTEISKEFSFEAAHRLPGVPLDHKCSRLHGHSFRVIITVTGPVDPQVGWVVDFAEVKEAFAPLHKILDHNYLNEIEGLENPTSEMIGAWIIERFKMPGAKLVRVEVKETCTSSCTVYVED
jgi:6-pyruvoyltetrahydropterin/6-carboxytetrahydropterin synthase